MNHPIVRTNRIFHGSLRSGACALTLGTALLATGCPDPAGKFDEFLDETEEEREEAQQMADVGGALADVNGTFLFAIAASLSPTTPLQFISTQTFEAAPDGSGGTLDLVLQPLSLNVGSTTEPRMPVGDPIELLDIPVDAGGAFTDVSLGTLMVTGEANPITGSNITAEITISGSIQNEDLVCGEASGEVLSPIQSDLAGSTFASVRVEATDPASLPAEVVTACPGGGAGGTGGTGTMGTGDAGTGGMGTGTGG